MKKNLLLGLLVLVCVFSLSETTHAQCIQGANGKYYSLNGGECINTIVTAVPFLRIVSDARSGAMGDVGLAISPDANSIQFNSSKLVFAEEEGAISASYSPWLQALGLNDVYLAYLTGYKKIDEDQALTASLRYFSLGNIQYTDVNGENLNEGRPNEFEVAVGYSRRLAENFSAGITGKFIYSNLAAGQQLEGGEVIEAGLAGAADFSITYDNEIDLGSTNSDLMVALAVSNIGSKITYTKSLDRDFLPANIGLGAAWTLHLDDYNTLTFATDINKLLVPSPCLGGAAVCDLDGNGKTDYKEQSSIAAAFKSFGDAPNGFEEEMKELMYSFGMEYWYDQQFAVRAGYFSEHATKGGRKFLTVGVGLKYNVFGLNFSYLVPTTNQRNPLDNTLRFSLLFDFANYNE
ncbi:MAG: type IX secretion system outer membrane channel protein PorV [Saprospiraceae bacterium]